MGPKLMAIAIGSFKLPSEAVLYEVEKIASSSTMPEGWQLSMPFGGQRVTVRLWTLEPGFKGAYCIRLSSHIPTDEWERAGLTALHDMIAFVAPFRNPITPELLAGIATEFHQVWTTGTVNPMALGVKGAVELVVDENKMGWVTSRGDGS